MEKFMQRENVYQGYNSARTSSNSEELDFNDVFGGPPRRFSMQEVKARYSFGETVESSEEERAGLKEMPVFGEESTPRRRHQGDDFFDDIFKGGESNYSSPRRTDRDNVFGSNPGSRIMSPSRPLPPKADPFGTSLPAQFSLPAKLTKAMDYPTFGSHNHGEYKVDVATNGLNSPHTSSPLSRFSNQAIRGHDEIRNEVHLVPRQSPLSNEDSLVSEDSPSTDQKDNIQNSKKDTRNADNIGSQFHFSIYKWAGRGVPMLMPLVAVNNLKSKDNMKYDKSASSNGRTESKSSAVGLSAAEPQSLRRKQVEEDLTSKKEINELQQELDHEFPEIKSASSPNDTFVSDGAKQSSKEEKMKPLDESDVREKIVKEVPAKKTESLKSELKPLHAVLDESDHPGNFTEMKDKIARTPKGVRVDAHDNKHMKEKEGIGIDSDTAKVKKSSTKGAAIKLGVTQGKSVSKGKVKEFVQIFNQEGDSRPKADFQRSRSARWRNVGADRKENEVSSNAAKAKEQVNLHNVDKKPDVSLKVDEKPNNDEAQKEFATKTASYTSNRSSSNLRKSFSAETLHRDSKISENPDDPLEDNFQVQELSDDHENVTECESSDTKALDAKLRQWSVGKKGNIRSLLSTLQYVLWPDSGWKPVPLVDLIEANSVKRAYQKALLRLHPDKLQQKGAAFHQKYTAEKVFDILQEAWDHFNTCSSLNVG